MEPDLRAPRPAGWWLNFFIWGLIALAYLIYFLADTRLDFIQVQVPCAGPGCNYLAVSQAEFEELDAWGISGRAYAWIIVSASLITAALYWALSALILWRSGNSRIGWTVSLTLVVWPATVVADVDNVVASFPQWEIPSFLLATIGISILFLFWYLIPNGQFYPRWAFIPMLVTIFVGVLFYFIFNGVIPFPPNLSWLVNMTTMLSLIALAPIFQYFRFRNNLNPIERQQAKWIYLGMVPLLLSFALAYPVFFGGIEIPNGIPRLLATAGGWIVFLAGVCALPLALTISILRFRLWDIDLIIRRTLQYALLTGILAVLYYVGIVLVQPEVLALLGQSKSPVFIVITTLGIAALFNPIRLRVQGFIDRRFYRARYDTELTLQNFAATARDEVDLDRLSEAMLNTVENTLQPVRISLWLLDNPE